MVSIFYAILVLLGIVYYFLFIKNFFQEYDESLELTQMYMHFPKYTGFEFAKSVGRGGRGNKTKKKVDTVGIEPTTSRKLLLMTKLCEACALPLCQEPPGKVVQGRSTSVGM